MVAEACLHTCGMEASSEGVLCGFRKGKAFPLTLAAKTRRGSVLEQHDSAAAQNDSVAAQNDSPAEKTYFSSLKRTNALAP